MDVVHVSKENQENVCEMLAAVLWLGNVTFSLVDDENHVEPVVDEGNAYYLGIILQIFYPLRHISTFI